jgi:NAD(P)-dependent dehydrogenase (short-subunit alcohol dehydrogenase family)
MRELRDKVAVITGGAAGLGRATALLLAEEGAEIVIADVDEERGRATAQDVGGYFVATDVSDLAANQAMAQFALDTCGRVDLAFLNAGVSTNTWLGDDFDLELYRRAMGVNLDGVVFGVQALMGPMKVRGGGAIVATASLAGLTGVALDPIYSANKHAVVGLARSLGAALQPDDITYNAICPGFAESRIVDDLRDALAEQGVELIPAETVADTVVQIITGGATGEAWFVQPHREPAPFRFRNVPGPRGAEPTAEG